MLARRLVPALLFALAPVLARAAAPGVYAVTGGTVHPVSGGEIANGVVLIRDGLIEAVGANLAVPADATTIDAKGMHVYPGLIDAQTSFGFVTAAPTPRRRRGGGGGGAAAAPAAEPAPETSPAYVALRNVKLSEDDAESLRAIGVTTIVTVPSSGIFNGQTAVLNLGEGSTESRAIKSPASLQVSFNTRPAWTYPDSLMGVISYIRQTLLDAQQYAAAHAIYDRSPAGMKRPPEDESLAALAPVLRGELPIVFVAESELMMRRAQRIAKEMNVKYVLAGARQAYRMADDLKGVPVLVSVKWPTAPTTKEDREEQPLRVIRDRQLAPTSPATLAKNGIAFALVSGTGKIGDYVPGIRKAIENGLLSDDALRATTSWPAKILGIDRQLGTLERGKIANVVLTDKPLFAKDAKVKRVFVDGRETKLATEEEKAEKSGTSPIDGAWSISVRTAQGDVSITASLHNDDGKLTGTFSGDAGSGDVKNGTFDGTTVDFAITAHVSNAEAGDWVFHGTLANGQLSGTVSTALGTQPFTGRKTP